MGKNQPLAPEISVITAVFNGVEVLGRQMDALASQQTDFPWEYIVVDNGSDDSSLQLVRDKAKSFPVPITIVDGAGRPHIPRVRNLGVRHARAERLFSVIRTTLSLMVGLRAPMASWTSKWQLWG